MQEKLMIKSSDITRLLGTVGSPLIVISELIKNAVDADATVIEVKYDRKNNRIQVIDNGFGISLAEIENLARPGYSSKKTDENIRNKHGFFFTGNKGLGILSCFSLCENIVIDTVSENLQKCHAILQKDGTLDYELNEKECECSTGTTITMNGIRSVDMKFLNTPIELQKIRHLSTYLYKKEKLPFPKITLQIDDDEPTSIFLDTQFVNMLYDVTFSYDKVLGKLLFKCIPGRGKDINSDTIEISSFDLQNLEKIVLEYFNIKKTIKTRTNDEADYQSYTNLEDVPSFEGRILVFDNQNAGPILKQYGAGVNIYVNQFALYNYLSADNDWLGLADFSQRKKVTNLRPHNVFGYVNFEEFNENEEVLRISNERADFIQDQIYTKLMYLLKGALMFLIFNIDVAEKNPKYKAQIDNNQTSVSESRGSEASNRDNSASCSGHGVNNVKSENMQTQRGEESSFNSKKKNSETEKGKENSSESENTDDTDDVYLPEDNYKPPKRFISGLSFTKSEGKVIEKLKNKDNLSNKIYHLTYEITHLNMQSYCCSISGVYRALLECSTRYIAQKYPDKIKFTEECLRDNIINVLNYYGNGKAIDKQVKAWRETVNKRYLVDTLNQYMHTEAEVDVDFIEQTWKTMKSYIIKCISE